jgi:hypothetical protein
MTFMHCASTHEFALRMVERLYWWRRFPWMRFPWLYRCYKTPLCGVCLPLCVKQKHFVNEAPTACA